MVVVVGAAVAGGAVVDEGSDLRTVARGPAEPHADAASAAAVSTAARTALGRCPTARCALTTDTVPAATFPSAGDRLAAGPRRCWAIGTRRPSWDMATWVSAFGMKDNSVAEERVTAELEPDPVSVGSARRLVARALEEWRREELVDTATLVVSELVTNAVLHARSPVVLTLLLGDDGVRIEVADASPEGPAPKDYSANAATGRGLHVISGLATEWGVRDVPGDGKVVWIDLSQEHEWSSVAEPDLSQWSDLEPGDDAAAGGAGADPDSPELLEVAIVGLLVDLQRRVAEHHDELMREFALILARRPDHQVPARLLDLVAELNARFGAFTAGTQNELAAAERRGDETVDLRYRVPPDVSPAAVRLGRLLDEADEYCRAGDLLTLATPGELLDFRRWFLEEFVRQSSGDPARPWNEWWAGRGAGSGSASD